jgi:ketosteroid isomerase-like protein
MNTITDILPSETFQTEARARSEILNSMLTALSKGKITEFVERFGVDFQFTDHALNLHFREHQKLTEFLEKSRELFPDTVVEVRSIVESKDYAIAEWTLTATETAGYGSTQLRLPILFSGVSVVQIRNERVVHWSDYYDALNSRRMGLAAFFTEWAEL